MGLYEMFLSMSLLRVGMGTMLANFHMRLQEGLCVLA